jgi:hypothetical protein
MGAIPAVRAHGLPCLFPGRPPYRGPREPPPANSVSTPHPPTTPVVLRLGLILFLGAPVAFVVWHNLSELLAGRPHGRGLLLTALLIPVAVVLTRMLVRTVSALADAE